MVRPRQPLAGGCRWKWMTVQSITEIGSFRRKPMNTKKFLATCTILLLLLTLFVSQALAVHDLGLFELDRNAQDDVPAAAPGDDWDTLYTGGGSANDFTGILPDIGADGGTQFQGG